MGLGEISSDPFHNVICTVRESRPGEPHLLLQAHLDEIGFMVTGVDEDGLLTVTPCGGLDRRLLLASPVSVYTEDGVLPGVVAYCPPAPQRRGGDAAKATEKIDMVTPRSGRNGGVPGDPGLTGCMEPVLLEHGLITAKALDNRCGCAAVRGRGSCLPQSGRS